MIDAASLLGATSDCGTFFFRDAVQANLVNNRIYRHSSWIKRTPSRVVCPICPNSMTSVDSVPNMDSGAPLADADMALSRPRSKPSTKSHLLASSAVTNPTIDPYGSSPDTSSPTISLGASMHVEPAGSFDGSRSKLFDSSKVQSYVLVKNGGCGRCRYKHR